MKSLRQRIDSEGWPLCECCGGRKPAGCQTYDEVMGEFYNEQMAEHFALLADVYAGRYK